MLHERNLPLPPLSTPQIHKTGDGENNDSLLSKYGPEPDCKDPTQVPSENKRARSHPTRVSHCNDLSERLNAKDRRKLLALKGEKMTLRQVGPQFAHLDTDFLRQV